MSRSAIAERVYQAARRSTLPEGRLSELLPPTIVIAGPTGVGKTALSLRLAEALPVEIVSADSRQVYRGLDIGTAKVSPEERQRAVHHLIDIVDPADVFTVVQFQELGRAALESIREREKIALIVGGTGHYVQALSERFSVPRVEPDWDLRHQLETEAARDGAAALHARLAERDPLAAERIPPANIRRVIRALEVVIHTGKPFSEQSRLKSTPAPVLRLALTMDRQRLYEIVDRRVDSMMANGWLDEVRGLVDRGLGMSSPPMSSSGYRELAAALRGELTLAEAIQRAKFSVHAYIRRQYIWLRRQPEFEWIEVEPGYEDSVIERAERYLVDLASNLRQS